MPDKKKILYVVNVDWFFISHRLPLALEAKKRGYEVFIATKDTGHFKDLWALGLNPLELNVNRSGTNPIREFFFILRLILILRKIKPEIIHNVTLKMSIYSSIASRFIHNIKVINAISGLGYNFTGRRTKNQKIIDILMKLAFRKRGYSFIFQNPDDLELFQKMDFSDGNKFYLIKGAGVDLNIFTYTERINRNSVCFILTARMLKDKGISEFVTASRIVSEKFPGSRFLLVGETDKENLASFEDDELSDELSGTNVSWLGHRDDVLELLKESDVMVFPSYREGLPKSLIEAAAVGLPIITTDTPGCRECVTDCVNGFLVPVGNSKILAERMIYLIENPVIRTEWGSHHVQKQK